MSIDSSLKEAVVHEAYDLHCDFQNLPYEDKQLSELDGKIQNFIKHYGAINPHGAEHLMSEYNANIKTLMGDYSGKDIIQQGGLLKLLEKQLKHLDTDIMMEIVTDIPDAKYDEMIQRQDRFAKAVGDWHIHDEGYVKRLEEILKDGPIDINACRDDLGRSVMESMFDNNGKNSNVILEFLLSHGAKILPQHAEKLIRYFELQLKYSPDPLNEHLLELMIQQGFDLNPKGAEGETLLGLFMSTENRKMSSLLVFFGAGDGLDHKLFAQAGRDFLQQLTEAIDIRESVLEAMQKPKNFSISQFTPEERAQFVKSCKEKQLFRDVYEVRGLVKSRDMSSSTHPKTRKINELMTPVVFQRDENLEIPAEAAVPLVKHYQEIMPDLENRINRHDQFIKACINGDLEAAGALLKEGDIDVNALTVQRQFPADLLGISYDYPLLNHACLKGDLKLIDLLIKAGAKVNASHPWGTSAQDLVWLPAIIEAVLFAQEKRADVLDRLIKAGADINPQDRVGNLWTGSRMYRAFNPSVSEANAVEALHSFMNLGVDISVFEPIFEKLLKGDWHWSAGGADSRQEKSVIDAAKPKRQELVTAMIYYGVDVTKDYVSELVEDFMKDAIKIRNEALQEMWKEEIGQGILKFSMDVAGEVGKFEDPNEIVKNLKPKERLTLYQKCQEKVATTHQ